jgi:hypothetical protein
VSRTPGRPTIRSRITADRAIFVGMRSVREPSPPFEHVSWREEVEHDAASAVTSLAVTVMGRDAEPPHAKPVPTYLAKIARYPLWAISVRALFGAALVPLPMFLYAGTRYHYVAHASAQASASAQSYIDQNALLAGVTVALGGALIGAVLGALWGLLVVRYARRQVGSAE